MPSFQVLINGVRLSSAAVDGDGVLSAIVNWVTANPKVPRAEKLNVHLGGITGGKYTVWVEQDLAIGDEVIIRIVEGDHSDTPTHIVVDNEERIREGKRRYYEQLKKEFGESEDA